MLNPYESTPTSVPQRTGRGSLQYLFVIAAGLVGYGLPIVSLGLMAWLKRGWPAAMDNLGRVVKIHLAMSFNTFLAFLPHGLLAIIFATAMWKWLNSENAHRLWWVLGCAIIVGNVVVLDCDSRWNIIPWTWSSELSNATRTAWTLMFPVGVYLAVVLNRQRTKL